MREGWTYKKLGEVCTIIGRIGFRGYKRTDYVESENEGAISLSPSNIIDGKLDYSKNTYITWEKYEESPEIKIFDGDVLLVKTASVGKSAIVRNLPHEATINPQFVVFKNIITNNEYLAYVIKSVTFLRQLQQITSGSSVPTLSQKALAELIIPLPPKSQQEAIVSELDEINSLLALKREQLQKYDMLAQSLFYEMFGDPIENEKGWVAKKLGELCTIERGGSPRPIKDYITDEEDGLNWIKIGDATEGSIYIQSTKEKIRKEGLKKTRMVFKGDFILSNSMSFGKPYILGIDGCIHDGWLVIHDDKGCFDKLYLYHSLAHPSMYSQFKNMAVGGVVNNLNSEMVRKVSVLVPPLPLQQQFASRIEQIESQKQQVQAAIEKLETLLASRMQYWFE